MATTKTIQVSFAGGEISSDMHGRADDIKYQNGLQLCRNFVALPQGPVRNRPGFAYVNTAKYSNKKCRLIPFTFNNNQTCVIELGDHYARFHSDGGSIQWFKFASPKTEVQLNLDGDNEPVMLTVTDEYGDSVEVYSTHRSGQTESIPGWYVRNDNKAYMLDYTNSVVSYAECEITTPWAEADLFELHYTQTADVITIVHPNYDPKKLCRYGWDDWAVESVVFTAQIATPTNVTAVRFTAAASDSNADKYTFKYKVSALNDDKTRESEPSAAVSVVANLYATGTTVKVSWSAVQGAKYYRVYKCQGGLYCYMADTEDLEVIDDNVEPKADITPRRYDTTFSQAGGKPSAVANFEQRKIYAGFSADPQRIIMTRSGTEDDMTYSLPHMDDDRISFQIAARQFDKIEHIIPLAHLIILTSGGEMRVSPLNQDNLTPDSVTARPQTYNGASKTQPVLVNNSIIYSASRGGHVLEFSYHNEAGGYTASDISIRATHFFDFKSITDLTLSKSPYPVVWAVSSDGSILGCTFIAEQNLAAWHKHTTSGVVESVCSVAEGTEDHLYVVVKRTLNEQIVRTIERMESFNYGTIENAFFVDCGGTYDGTATSTKVTTVHIPWLTGETVSILADGAVCPQQVVDSSGNITLTEPAMVVHVGLPYQSDVQTLPVAIQNMPAMGMGHPKNVFKGTLRMYKSSGLFVGPDFENLVEYKQRTTEQPGSPPALKTGDVTVQLKPFWNESGSVCVRQVDPLPTHLLSLALELAV